jgi:hypothetical protein
MQKSCLEKNLRNSDYHLFIEYKNHELGTCSLCIRFELERVINSIEDIRIEVKNQYFYISELFIKNNREVPLVNEHLILGNLLSSHAVPISRIVERAREKIIEMEEMSIRKELEHDNLIFDEYILNIQF